MHSTTNPCSTLAPSAGGMEIACGQNRPSHPRSSAACSAYRLSWSAICIAPTSPATPFAPLPAGLHACGHDRPSHPRHSAACSAYRLSWSASCIGPASPSGPCPDFCLLLVKRDTAPLRSGVPDTPYSMSGLQLVCLGKQNVTLCSGQRVPSEVGVFDSG